MTISFDGLLRSIHPKVTIERFEQQANAAALRFRVPSTTPRTARDLLLHLAALQHQMSQPVDDRTPFPAMHFEAHARVVEARLRSHFRGRGIAVAMQIVQAKGVSGLREIREVLIQSHAQERTRRVVKRRVDAYWLGLNAQGRILAAKYYLAKFSPFLADEQRRRDPVRLATVLPSLLYEHPFRLRDLLSTELLRS